jgi:hypothetical protein
MRPYIGCGIFLSRPGFDFVRKRQKSIEETEHRSLGIIYWDGLVVSFRPTLFFQSHPLDERQHSKTFSIGKLLEGGFAARVLRARRSFCVVHFQNLASLENSTACCVSRGVNRFGRVSGSLGYIVLLKNRPARISIRVGAG